MVVLMIALTFLVFVAVDLLREHHRRADLVREGESLHNALEEEEPSWVAGFKVPQPLSYHPGHMWVHWVSPDQAYVGLDDFGRRLIGERAKFSLPWVGTHVGQGEESIRVGKNGEHIELLSPVGGEVIEGNSAVADDPALINRDPEGDGWFFKLKLADPGELHGLMEEAAYREWVKTL